MVFLFEPVNWFLLVIGFIWIVGAILQDLKRREVDNVWNFSLIGIALGYRAIISVFLNDYRFFLYGVFGLFVFIILGNVFYYSRFFAGGDAKLLIALGPILPFRFEWLPDVTMAGSFILLSFVFGSVYVFIWSLFLVAAHWDAFVKEYAQQWKIYRRLLLYSIVFSVIFTGILYMFRSNALAFVGLVFVLFPFLFIFAKAVEESCMVKSMNVSDLTPGEWLYRDIVVNGKTICSRWEGISPSEVVLIKKYKKRVLIKLGVPFTPSFLFGFLALLSFLGGF
jgi:Flp pilus assembly protein protease CpaA